MNVESQTFSPSNSTTGIFPVCGFHLRMSPGPLGPTSSKPTPLSWRPRTTFSTNGERRLPNTVTFMNPPRSTPHRLEGALILLDQALEGRSGVDPFDIGRELRPALAVDLALAVAEVHQDRAHGEVADREAIADQVVVAPELRLEVVEERRQRLVGGLLDERLVARLLEEERLEHALLEERDRAVDQAAVGELLEPDRARVVEGVARVERRRGLDPLEVGDDRGRVRERPPVDLEARDLPERVLLLVLGRDTERDHRVVLVGEPLLREGDARLADERGEAGSDELEGHGWAPCRWGWGRARLRGSEWSWNWEGRSASAATSPSSEAPCARASAAASRPVSRPSKSCGSACTTTSAGSASSRKWSPSGPPAKRRQAAPGPEPTCSSK